MAEQTWFEKMLADMEGDPEYECEKSLIYLQEEFIKAGKRITELEQEVERLKDLIAKHEQIEEYFDNTPIEEVKEGYYELECKRLRSALEMAKNLYAGLCESAIEYHTPSELRVSSEVLAKLGEVLQQALYIIGPNIKGVE